MATIEEFQKLDLRTAKILNVEEHPNASKLYVLKISFGDEERQIVAGLRGYYEKDELIGKTIIVVKNLEPAVLRGIKSEGMLLAAENEGKIVLLTTEKEIKENAKIR